jgi:hypothetical protein
MRKTLIKRKKITKSKRTRKNNKRRRHQKGGGIGSDLRQQLVSLCRQGKWTEYDTITQRIIDDYRLNSKNDFLIHLDNQMSTFKRETALCLERSLTQLQEDGIPESMVHLARVLDMRDGRI